VQTNLAQLPHAWRFRGSRPHSWHFGRSAGVMATRGWHFLGCPVAPMFAHAEPGVAPAHDPELRLLEKQILLPSSAWVWMCFPFPFPLPALAPFCGAWYGAWFW
jgi:hypothetical protein